MQEQLNVRGESSPKNDPYRFWLTGLVVELAVFAAYGLVVVAAVVLTLQVW